MPFQHFPKENEIFKNARISVPTTRVFGKYPRVRQICSQMERLAFLEICKMNWGSAKATNHCGTFSCRAPMGKLATKIQGKARVSKEACEMAGPKVQEQKQK